MKTLLITTLLTCSFGMCSMAQEKSESIKNEPKVHVSKKASNKVFPSAVNRQNSKQTQTSSGTNARSEESRMPKTTRKINDPKIVEERKIEKTKNSKNKKNKNFEESTDISKGTKKD